MTIYIAWINDMLIGVFDTQVKAADSIQSYANRTGMPPLKQVSPVKWHLNGPERYARLEVTHHVVQ